MITRIEIDGFKSLRDVAVDLEPLTAVVGVNGSGKSNFVEALALLSRLTRHDLNSAFRAQARGTIREQFTRTPFDDGSTSTRLRLAAELSLDPAATSGVKKGRYEISVRRTEPSPVVDPGVGRDAAWMEISDEILRSLDPPDVEQPLIRRGSGWPTITYVGDDRPLGGHVDRDVPFLTILPDSFQNARRVGSAFKATRSTLDSVTVLQCIPRRLRESSDPSARPGLETDGANLPTTFAALPAEEQAVVVADMADLVPGLRDITVSKGSDGLLDLRFDFDGQEFPARLVSDGTLRLLALLTVAHAASGGGTAVIEEPENGVHPGSLRRLIEKLCAATDLERKDGVPPQFILVSHSPALVAALEDQPESLVFAQLVLRGDGTRATRLVHVRQPGDPLDHGRTSVSPREVTRLLETADPARVE